MAIEKKKLTGKDISTTDVLRVVGDGATFAQMAAKLGLRGKDERALDGALQREKRAGRVRFDLGERRWFKLAEQPATKAKRGRRAA